MKDPHFLKFMNSLKQLEQSEGVIVNKSQFVGKQPLLQQKISKTNEDAKHEAAYRAVRTGQPIDNDKKTEDAVVSKFIRDFFGKLGL